MKDAVNHGWIDLIWGLGQVKYKKAFFASLEFQHGEIYFRLSNMQKTSYRTGA